MPVCTALIFDDHGKMAGARDSFDWALMRRQRGLLSLS
jgi:hypothetical protein